MVNKGWATIIDLESEGGISPPQRVLVNYDNLSIRCKVCNSWKHKVKDCMEIPGKPWRGARRPPLVEYTHQQVREKGDVMDQDGLQQVQSRRGIRRNIFEDVEDELRQHESDQRINARKYTNQVQPEDTLVTEAVGLGLGSRQGIGKPRESAGINEAVPGVTTSTKNKNRPKLMIMR